MDEPNDENISVTSKATYSNILKEHEKKKKVGAPNLSVEKIHYKNNILI